jgi:hypothetical protein
MQNAPQGVFTVNFVYQLDEASKHFAHIITETVRRGMKVFDVRAEAEASYLKQMWKRSPAATDRKPGCTPGYCECTHLPSVSLDSASFSPSLDSSIVIHEPDLTDSVAALCLPSSPALPPTQTTMKARWRVLEHVSWLVRGLVCQNHSLTTSLRNGRTTLPLM